MGLEDKRDALEGMEIGDYRVSGTLSQSGGVVFLTATTLSMDINDLVVKVTTTDSAADTVITLPSVVAAKGRIFAISLDTIGDDETCTVQDLADDAGYTDAVLDTADDYVILYSNGYRWFELAAEKA